jgi:hypothetical protein
MEPSVSTLRHFCVSSAVLLAALAAPSLGWASSATSSASDSVSTSVGSLSKSIENSSNSSSKKNEVAAGDYRIIEVAAVPERPGKLRLTLQAIAAPGEEGGFYLYLPQEVVQQAQLVAGNTVKALARDYGLAFAKEQTPQPFFLVMKDDWHQELQSNVVAL